MSRNFFRLFKVTFWGTPLRGKIFRRAQIKGGFLLGGGVLTTNPGVSTEQFSATLSERYGGGLHSTALGNSVSFFFPVSAESTNAMDMANTNTALVCLVMIAVFGNVQNAQAFGGSGALLWCGVLLSLVKVFVSVSPKLPSPRITKRNPYRYFSHACGAMLFGMFFFVEQ